MPFTDLEKLNFRACCEIIGTHTKNLYLKDYARAGIHAREDHVIENLCHHMLRNMSYERRWIDSKFSPRDARNTLKHMIKRCKVAK